MKSKVLNALASSQAAQDADSKGYTAGDERNVAKADKSDRPDLRPHEGGR